MRRLLYGLAIGLMAAAALAAPTVASTPSTTTFADVIARSKLVIFAQVVDRPDGGFTFEVIQVLKGSASARLVYPSINTAPPLAGWSRAVIAFANPANDDFRAPTIAWHVASNGAIDPEHDQRYPGLPLTLGAMLAYFGSPQTSTAPSDLPTPTNEMPVLAAVFLVAAWATYRSSRFALIRPRARPNP
jgi:hypothetical protein